MELDRVQEITSGFEIQKLEKISYFREKYSNKICDRLEIDLNHPFLDELLKSFDNHIVGQKKAKDYLSQAVLNTVLRVGEHRGPLGVFFFHGPTGVGKTEIVKALADIMFRDPNGFIKINCENFSDRHTGSNLFGSAKGYVGYSDQTPLNNKNVMLAYDVAKKSGKLNPMIKSLPWFNILLFDEIEKAHNDIIQQLLSLIDDGKVTLSNGEKVNFSNSIIIFTSNIGEGEKRELNDKNGIGFTINNESKEQDQEKIFQKALKEKFSPEFIGRIHNFVGFEPLNSNDCKDIIDIQVNKFNDYLLKYFTESHLQIELSPNVYDYLEREGFSQEKGARYLVRNYNKLVKSHIDRLFHSDSFRKYYNYEGKILVGIDIDRDGKLFSEIILDGVVREPKEDVKFLEHKEYSKFNLEKLQEIFGYISAYIELSYLAFDDSDIDIKDGLIVKSVWLKGLIFTM